MRIITHFDIDTWPDYVIIRRYRHGWDIWNAINDYYYGQIKNIYLTDCVALKEGKIRGRLIDIEQQKNNKAPDLHCINVKRNEPKPNYIAVNIHTPNSGVSLKGTTLQKFDFFLSINYKHRYWIHK